MSSILEVRISLESKAIQSEGIALMPQTPYLWVGYIRGKGKWKGQTFEISIDIPMDYPYVPPIVNWNSPMNPSHPNIFPFSHYICLNILDPFHWKPTYTLVTVYRALEWLLDHPNYRG